LLGTCVREKRVKEGARKCRSNEKEIRNYSLSRALFLGSASMESKGGPRKKRERVRSLGDDDDATN